MLFQQRKPQLLGISSMTQNLLQANSMVHWNSPDLYLPGLHMGHHAGKVKSPAEAWDDWWPCRPSGKRCHKNTSTRNFTKCLTAKHGCGCQLWSRWASAVTLSITKSALSSHHQQTGSFQSHQQTISVKTAFGTLRNEGCLGWNSVILSFSEIIQQNSVVKCMFYCLTAV